MKKYIEIVLGGPRYRFLIDEELDKILRSLLKDKYIFDENGILIIEDDLSISYEIKELILKSIINQINTYWLTPELQRQIESLKRNLNKKGTIYSSDLSNLDNVLYETSQIYERIRNSAAKKDSASETKTPTVETKISSTEQIPDINNAQQSNIENVSSTEQTITSDTAIESLEEEKKVINEEISSKINTPEESIPLQSSSFEDQKEEFKEIVEDIALDEEFSNKIPVSDINNALDRVVICSSMEEFIAKTTSNNESYNVNELIKDKSKNIVLPPDTKIADITSEILKTCLNDDALIHQVVTYVDRKKTFKNKTDSALDALRSSLKVGGLNARNLNYYGDQFFNTFEAICRKSGMSFETMFSDYFSYSANKKYNSPMDKFMRLFIKYNGGDENTRALLEAMLVKKAMARHLISTKYNRYLRSDLQNLAVNGNGYINFNENYFKRSPAAGAATVTKKIETESSTHLGANPNSYEKDLNINQSSTTSTESKINSELTKENKEPQVSESVPSSESKETDLNSDQKLTPPVITGKRRKIPSGINVSEQGTIVDQSMMYGRKVTGLSGRRFTANTSLNPSLIREEGEINTEETQETIEDSSNMPVHGSHLRSSQNPESSEDRHDNNDDNENNNQTESGSNESENTNDQKEESQGNLAETAGEEIKELGKKQAKKLLIEFIKKNPVVLVIGGLIIFLFIILLIAIASSNNENKNSYGLGGYEYIELSNVCEEIYVYDTPSGEDGLYPLEEYIAGVVAHEVGAFNNDTLYEVFAIAARTYALRRLQNSSECSIAGNTTAQVFGKTDNQKIIDAVNRTRGVVLTEYNNLVSTEYDAFCWDTKDDNYYHVCQKNHDTDEVLKVPVDWAKEYVGKISGQKFLTTPRYQSHGRGMSQQGAFYLASEQNYTRGQILSFFYGSEAKLMSIYPSSYSGEFPLNPNDPLYKNLKLLINKPLSDVLAESGSSTEEFNNYLANIVETSGVGTREAVVNVAVSLIGNLANMGYKLNYQWNGKYYNKGINSNWGKDYGAKDCGNYGKQYDINKCLTNYRWLSFDCSGLVNWSLLNGLGYSSESEYMRSGVYTKTRTDNANRVKLDPNKAVCQAGDVMIKPGHIVLVVGHDDSRKSYIVAESRGSNILTNEGGVKLSYYSYGHSGYFCGDMSFAYEQNKMEE